jgi:catechol 2,3-dioxygenase-like lactoylglutathione lyase family enzyme
MLTEVEQIVEHSRGALSDARIIYLFLYVNDLEESRAFYEGKLGLRVLEADSYAIKYDVGQIILCLNRASDYGITLSGRRDDASDVVFLVDDINVARQALEARGVQFIRRRTYEIGFVIDFYDPNGHRLMIYEPSQVALSWASGDKLRAVWRAAGRGGTDLIGPAANPGPMTVEEMAAIGLDGKPLIYLFLFVPTSDQALDFYQGDLGLRSLERVHCCNPACPPEELGVAKYDGGGLLLTTHHVHRSPVLDDYGNIYSPRSVDPAHTKGIVPTFYVTNMNNVVEHLSRRGIDFGKGITRSQIGAVATFEAPTGHTFFLYEPSEAALRWTSGIKIKEILSTQL